MKKLVAWLILLLPVSGYCDSKLSALPSTTTLSATDIIPVVTGINGTPANKVITFNNFTNSMTSVTISNASGLPLRLEQPGMGSVSQGISFTNTGVQRAYLRVNDFNEQCSDISTACTQTPFELGGSAASFFFNTDGRLFTSQGTLRKNAYSSVIGGSLIVGGTGNYNYTDTQQIGDGNLLVNNGVITSTLSVVGPGDGQITLTVGVSTYTVTYSSVAPTVGQTAVASSTNGAIVWTTASGGTPGGSNTQLQYNNNGAFGGISNTTVCPSSVTVSTFGIVVGVTKTSNLGLNGTGGAGALDVFFGSSFTNKTLFDVGSSALADQFYIPNNGITVATNGFRAGQLVVGDTSASGQRIYSNGDINSFFDLRNGSTATINTGTANGPGDIRLQPGGVLALTASNKTGMTMTANTAATWDVAIGTSTASFQVAVSTNGHFITNGPIPAVSSCGGGTPSVQGGSTDVNGFITTGTGVFSSCTLTFATPFVHAPSCVIEDDTTVLTAPPKVTTTTTTMIVAGVTITASDVINYICFGN